MRGGALALSTAAFLCAAGAAEAADVTGRVHVRQLLAGGAAAGDVSSSGSASASSSSEPTRVVLNGGEYSAVARRDGSFRIPSVPSGVYLLEVFHPSAAYSTYKVNVPREEAGGGGDASSSIQVVEYRYPGATMLPSRHPIEAFPVAAAVYFEERPKFNIMSLLGNQMVRGEEGEGDPRPPFVSPAHPVSSLLPLPPFPHR
jgi:hypothetical protein